MTDLAVRDLTVEFVSAGYAIRPLDGLSFAASSGELVVVLGPSGSGKTTLLSCLAGILTPTSGRIEVGDAPVTELRGRALAAYRSRTVGLVFQSFNLIPSLTASENVQAPLLVAGSSRREARQRAAELLELVALTDRAGHRPHQLSGGQQQRVAIARALVHEPPLVLADEPTAHLDHIQVEDVLSLLRRLAVPGRLVITVTHDARLLPLADRVVELVPSLSRRPPVAERVELAPGEVLFEQGSWGEFVYVVEEGVVELYRVRADGSEERLRVVTPGQYFGELGPLLRLPRTASARAAARNSVLRAITLDEFRRDYSGSPSRATAAPGPAAPAGPSRPASDAAPAGPTE